jgi:hypothetical protein
MSRCGGGVAYFDCNLCSILCHSQLFKISKSKQKKKHLPNLKQLPSKCWKFWVLMNSTNDTN